MIKITYKKIGDEYLFCKIGKVLSRNEIIRKYGQTVTELYCSSSKVTILKCEEDGEKLINIGGIDYFNKNLSVFEGLLLPEGCFKEVIVAFRESAKNLKKAIKDYREAEIKQINI